MDREALRMLRSAQFWRMDVLWTLSLLYSYLPVLLRGRAAVPRRRGPRPDEGRHPICVVTGVSTQEPPLRMRVPLVPPSSV